MAKAFVIDPGKSKCGYVIADIEERRVYQAEVIQSNDLLPLIKKIHKSEQNFQYLIGNGTSSKRFINVLSEFIPNLIIAEEKNSTYRAKQRYFEIFPLSRWSFLFPREIFIFNKNLDAIAALIIMEDYFKFKFKIGSEVSTKTWQK